jgi:2,3-bisphosphoglycerate-independent phosphoglycerate mutase
MTGPVALLILDGWGHSVEKKNNAVRGCEPSNLDELAARYASTLLNSSGNSVGLPDGQFGNSEVGHTCMGAGRIIVQALSLIDQAIGTGTIKKNPSLLKAMDAAASSDHSLHFLGLLSDGGVHSHLNHLKALLEMAKDRSCKKVFVHAFTDGRDTRPAVAQGFIKDLEQTFAALGAGSLATVSGRYYAMDRDHRWERVERAYRAMTDGVGFAAKSGGEAVETALARGETDEFIKPTVIAQEGVSSTDAPGLIRDGDSVIFFNFRADRAREITRALAIEDFDGFARPERLKLAEYVCMSQYDAGFPLPMAFPADNPDQIFGQLLSVAGWKQARIAETEKYAHVTFFFNGGLEQQFPGEERILIPSPRVATYDLKPEMSADQVAAAAIRCIEKNRDGKLAIILNFANADMVGHTGNYDAAVRACKSVDQGVGRIASSILGRDGVVIVTADHGNAEMMVDAETGGPHTTHTLSPVPFILAGDRFKGAHLNDGATLADIAPTLLDLMELSQPRLMTGKSLLTP